MTKLALRNHANIVLHIKSDFYKRPDGNAHAQIVIFDQPPRDIKDECDNLNPGQSIIFSCEPHIMSYKILYPKTFAALNFTPYTNEGDSIMNIIVTNRSQTN